MTPKQVQEAISYNQKEISEGDLTHEMVVRLLEFWQENHDLGIDGKGGPITQKSLESSMEAEWAQPTPYAKLESEEPDFEDGEWLPWDGPACSQPRMSEIKDFFGDPETFPKSNVMSKKWFRENIVECHERLGNRLPGVPAKWWIKVHKKVEPYLREALRRAQLVCPEYKITRLGSQNFRHIQRNPNKPLSKHAYGAAVDVNPSQNSAQRFRPGKAPQAYSEEYYRYWPEGVPRAFVQAFQSCGFAWGSDWDEDGDTDDHTFLDPMHFEWVARDGNNLDV